MAQIIVGQILLRDDRDANFSSHAKKKYTLGDIGSTIVLKSVYL